MALTGTTNTAANTAIRYLTQNQAMAGSSLAKLSSGSRIVKASDDAASLAVGTKIKADVTALKQAATNAAQASSLLQVADGGMARIADILQRMKALAVQAQSGSVTDSERPILDREFQQLSARSTPPPRRPSSTVRSCSMAAPATSSPVSRSPWRPARLPWSWTGPRPAPVTP
jgi:hypothetical protein